LAKAQLWKRHSFGKGSQGFGKDTRALEKAQELWKRHRSVGKGKVAIEKAKDL
jgi:hypothetical protein